MMPRRCAVQNCARPRKRALLDNTPNVANFESKSQNRRLRHGVFIWSSIKAMTLRALSDAELAKLSEGLRRFGDKRAMNIEQLDGFLSALVCSLEDIPGTEYLPLIWGSEMVNEDDFTAQPTMQELIFLIAWHREVIFSTLKSEKLYVPLLLAGEDGVIRANDWADGFLRGVALRREKWSSLFENEEEGGALVVPILALAHEFDPDPEMRPYSEPIRPELRERLIEGIAESVMWIFRHFSSRQRKLKSAYGGLTQHRISPKVGRNDPCPCGSGKKFKKCCGGIVLH
jgi:uncharacterized protein